MRVISGRKLSSIWKGISGSGAGYGIFVSTEACRDSSIRYLTGFEPSGDALLYFRECETHLVVNPMEYEAAENHASVTNLIKDNDVLSYITKMPGFGNGKAGVCKRRVTVGSIERMRLKKSDIIDISGIMSRQRSVKEERELAMHVKSASMANRGVKFISEHISQGMKESEVARKLRAYLSEIGSEKAPFDFIVTSGKRSALVHPFPSSSDAKIGKSLVIVDFGCVHRGYATDVTVPVTLGRPGVKEREIVNRVCEIYRDVIRHVKAGVKVSELFGIFESRAGEYGVKHSLGHGLGIDVHEYPGISNSDVKLEVNMVISIEPGIYVREVGGSRLENNVIVKKNGCEVITKARLINK